MLQVEVPLTTSKVEETLDGIKGRKEYYLKKRQSIKDGTYDAETDPEAHSKKGPAANGVASSSNGPTANGDVPEDFEHVSCQLMRCRLLHIADLLWKFCRNMGAEATPCSFMRCTLLLLLLLLLLIMVSITTATTSALALTMRLWSTYKRATLWPFTVNSTDVSEAFWQALSPVGLRDGVAPPFLGLM